MSLVQAIAGLETCFGKAAAEARKSLCLSSSCGALLLGRAGTVIGKGYNAPPLEPSARKPKADRTCWVHAEWRALKAALLQAPAEVPGSLMVFVRVNPQGVIQHSGRPYCTVCSRQTLDAGVESWALWHAEGIRIYPAAEYHRLSERYDELGGG